MSVLLIAEHDNARIKPATRNAVTAAAMSSLISFGFRPSRISSRCEAIDDSGMSVKSVK